MGASRLHELFKERLLPEDSTYGAFGYLRSDLERDLLHQNIKIDIYRYKPGQPRKNRMTILCEVEMVYSDAVWNVEKWEEIIPIWLKSSPILFVHVFSPFYKDTKDKEKAISKGRKLEKKYKNFHYVYLDIKVPFERFWQIKNRYESGSYYRRADDERILNREINRLTRDIIEQAKTMFPCCLVS